MKWVRMIGFLMTAVMILGVMGCAGAPDGGVSSAVSSPSSLDGATSSVGATSSIGETSSVGATSSVGESTSSVVVSTPVSEPESSSGLLPAAPLFSASVYNHTAMPLWPNGDAPYAVENAGNQATIQAFLVDGSKSCVVIFPGGGYFQLSVGGEGVEVAQAYNAQGISAFVVCYRYKPHDGKAILADGQRAIQFVRYYADTFGIDKDKIAVLGFSAGGHLAMLTCQHTPEENLAGDVIGAEDSRPNACVLAYAVTTLGDGTYETMPEVFLGEEKDNTELIEKYSYTYNVAAMPPSFIFYSKMDVGVDYRKNSINLAIELEKLGKKVLCAGYKDGNHGVGLGTQFEDYSRWLEDSVGFLRELGF